MVCLHYDLSKLGLSKFPYADEAVSHGAHDDFVNCGGYHVGTTS
jgi:hypothetical protein